MRAAEISFLPSTRYTGGKGEGVSETMPHIVSCLPMVAENKVSKSALHMGCKIEKAFPGRMSMERAESFRNCAQYGRDKMRVLGRGRPT